MTHNEFDHIATADPYCQDAEFLQAVRQDPQLASQVEEAKILTEKLQTLFSEPKADSVLVASLAENATKPRQNKRPLALIAMAASFLVAAVSFSIWQSGFQLNINNNLSQHALTHTQHDSGFAGLTNEQPSIASINYRLKSLGAQFNDKLSDVTWFNDCSFDGIDSLHMVFKGQEGRINVFLIAKDSEFSVQPQFSNSDYQGIAQELKSAYMLIVGEHNEALEPMKDKLTAALHWNI